MAIDKDIYLLEEHGYKVQIFSPYHVRVSMYLSNVSVDVWHTKRKLSVNHLPSWRYTNLVEDIEKIFIDFEDKLKPKK